MTNVFELSREIYEIDLFPYKLLKALDFVTLNPNAVFEIGLEWCNCRNKFRIYPSNLAITLHMTITQMYVNFRGYGFAAEPAVFLTEEYENIPDIGVLVYLENGDFNSQTVSKIKFLASRSVLPLQHLMSTVGVLKLEKDVSEFYQTLISSKFTILNEESGWTKMFITHVPEPYTEYKIFRFLIRYGIPEYSVSFWDAFLNNTDISHTEEKINTTFKLVETDVLTQFLLLYRRFGHEYQYVLSRIRRPQYIFQVHNARNHCLGTYDNPKDLMDMLEQLPMKFR